MSARDHAPLAQAAAIPFRIRDGVADICLVTSSSARKWGVPKGIVDPGHTPQETALIEAEEEAGLGGDIMGPAVGEYSYRKWSMDLRVIVFLMRVTTVADTWDEMSFRSRRWVAPSEALELVARHPPAELLERGLRRLSELSKGR